MSVGGIGPINNYNDYIKITKKDKVDKLNSSDSVNISNEAVNMADAKKVLDMVKNSPDIRADRVAEIKEKLNDPNYINNTILDSVADKIIDIFNI